MLLSLLSNLVMIPANVPGGGGGDGSAIGAANIGRRVEDGELGRKELLERLMRDEMDWMAFLEVFTKHIL